MRKRFLILWICICMLIAIPNAGAAGALSGDADRDGEVTAADASLILRYVSGLSSIGTSTGKKNADVNGDGNISSTDAAMILRYLVNLVELTTPAPTATATPATTPTPSSTTAVTLDSTLLSNVKKGLVSNYADYAEGITRFIQTLPTSNPYRAILYAGATHMGTPYSTLTCSDFVRTVYVDDCGYEKNKVYPGGSSDNVISWFKTNQSDRIHTISISSSGAVSTSGWRSGYVLAHVDANGKGNHVSIFIGTISGVKFVMESVSSKNGVVIQPYWSTDSYQLAYYINPIN